MKKYFIIRTYSRHMLCYAMSSEEDLTQKKAEIEEKINKIGPAEFYQYWDGEQVSNIEGPFTEEEFIKKHDELFPDLAKNTPNDEKLLVINYEKFLEEGPLLEDKELL